MLKKPIFAPKYFFSSDIEIRKISVEFRDKLLFYLKKEERTETLTIPDKRKDLKLLLEKLKQIPWVVHSQAPGGGKNKPQLMIRYLSRYVNKTAVSDKRIRKLENGNVHLSNIDRKNMKAGTEIISEQLFLKRLVMHILPKGFKKIRFYGFMANRCRKSMLTLCRMLLGIPLSEQTKIIEELNDTAFLFWKYFGVDITLCTTCGKGHISFIKTGSGGG